ncbi:MAG: sugar phosphate isomerase/epimerase, partial [Gemmatimonadaceae bacterium]|nr:sugar phosphate isomerase/epimerase [Chitinophagaceae bacterium]
MTAVLATSRCGSSKVSKDLGIQLYTVRNEVSKDLANTLKEVAAAGYKNIELYGYNNRQFFGKPVSEMAALLKQNNLYTKSGHYGLNDFLYNADYNWDSWKYLVEDANLLGNKYIIVPYLDDKHRTADDYKRVAERLNKGGEMAREAGMVAGYHNHDFELKDLGGQSGWDILLAGTDPKNVVFEMDIYWVEYAGQKPGDWFKKHPGRWKLWHVKDMEAKTAGDEKGQTCEVGKGIINWKEIFAQHELAGLEYPLVEQEQYTRPVFECIRMSADYMKS